MKYLKYFFIVLLAVFMVSCAPAKQNPYAKKRKKSHVSQSQLGRNKYFFSSEYQRKLKKSYKKKRY
jgi:hypothetical protein